MDESEPGVRGGSLTPALRFYLLGRFEAQRDGQPIAPSEWRGNKPRDLLKLLLLARGRYLSVEQLGDWLWPDADPAAAETNLRSAVSDLRKTLEPRLERGRDSAFILTRREGYAFNLDAPVWVDAIEFERALTASTRRGLAEALALYRGDLFEEDPLAEWALRERERLRDLCVEALARLAELCLAEADYTTAIQTAEQTLALDAGRETAWRVLMRTHAANGDRAAALRAFDRCRAALSRELGVDPLPETFALHAQLLRAEPEALPQLQSAAAPRGLYRLGALGLALWVGVSALGLGLSLSGLLQGVFVSPGDPGQRALPYLLANPNVLAEMHSRLYVFFPLGLLLLPGYLAWYAALRAGGAASTWAGLGLGLGLAEVAAQTVSRAISLAQVVALPSAYAAAAPEQQLALIALWDVLRQLASTFGILSEVGHPLALGLLCWAARGRPGFAPWLVGSGLGLAALTLLFYVALPLLGALNLALGLGLVVYKYVWLLALAWTLTTRLPDHPTN